MIFRLALPALLSLCLVGCNTTTYYAQGISLSERAHDQASCEAQAARQYPPRLVTRFTPRRFHPAVERCDASGNCVIRPAHWTGGRPYRVDLNENARRAALPACMADRGYARVTLPNCEAGQAVRASTRMPELRPDSCILNPGTTVQVVNPS